MLVAPPLLVLMATRSATDMGVVVAARLLSTLVFLLLGGAVTDRVSRRLAMVVETRAGHLLPRCSGFWLSWVA